MHKCWSSDTTAIWHTGHWGVRDLRCSCENNQVAVVWQWTSTQTMEWLHQWICRTRVTSPEWQVIIHFLPPSTTYSLKQHGLPLLIAVFSDSLKNKLLCEMPLILIIVSLYTSTEHYRAYQCIQSVPCLWVLTAVVIETMHCLNELIGEGKYEHCSLCASQVHL